MSRLDIISSGLSQYCLVTRSTMNLVRLSYFQSSNNLYISRYQLTLSCPKTVTTFNFLARMTPLLAFTLFAMTFVIGHVLFFVDPEIFYFFVNQTTSAFSYNHFIRHNNMFSSHPFKCFKNS